MIKAIMFDLWNTLIYDESGILKNMMTSLAEAGMKDPNDIFDKCLCRRKFKDQREASKALREWTDIDPYLIPKVFEAIDKQETRVFPDVLPNLKKLRGKYKLGLVSNATQFQPENIKSTGVFDFFDHVHLSYESGIMKQDKRCFRSVLKVLGERPEHAVMVGDIYNADIVPSERIGIKGVLIKRVGYPIFKNKNDSHAREIKSLDELEGILKPLDKKD